MSLQSFFLAAYDFLFPLSMQSSKAAHSINPGEHRFALQLQAFLSFAPVAFAVCLHVPVNLWFHTSTIKSPPLSHCHPNKYLIVLHKKCATPTTVILLFSLFLSISGKQKKHCSAMPYFCIICNEKGDGYNYPFLISHLPIHYLIHKINILLENNKF